MAQTVLAAGLLAITTGCLAKADEAPLDGAALISELTTEGFEFGPPDARDDGTYSRMHGSVEGLEYTLVGGNEDKIYTHDFIGPAEALVAATRVGPDGFSVYFPVDDEGGWVGISGYGAPQNMNVFVDGRTIVTHIGVTSELTDAVQRIMGEPFAGERAYEYWTNENGDLRESPQLEKFEDLWVTRPVQLSGNRIETRTVVGDDQGTTVGAFVVLPGVQVPASKACRGERRLETEVLGDEIHITYEVLVANTDKLDFVEECSYNIVTLDMERLVRGLDMGQTYTIIYNGEPNRLQVFARPTPADPWGGLIIIE